MNLTQQLKNGILERLALTKELASKTSIELYKDDFTIDSSELIKENSEELSKRIKSYFKNSEDDIIYTVELVGCDKYEKVQENFETIKKKKKGDRSYSKVNDKNDPCKYLYVGSSQRKNLATRIRNHFGLGGKTVYSMHLLYSFPKDINCKIKITLYKIDMPSQEDNAINLLELYEQELWDKYKPMFGKQSGLL
ncbi:hypothetical protein [Maribacter aquivivus]|uniref:GIY-YIG domain-containing protein n=1 Tax=Maribacter aquivivus TaxID=228958 RepID=A0A1M6TSI2_9FLAO|nr:hypothetical protein [Maribacter aquivivus]SHK59876.1 hypothetical protein SAMN04488007_3345 [Maribacter aquivivus]